MAPSRRGRWQAEGELLAELLKRGYLSQHDVAKELMVSDAAVSSWINGTSKPRPDNLHRLARLLEQRGVALPPGGVGALWGGHGKGIVSDPAKAPTRASPEHPAPNETRPQPPVGRWSSPRRIIATAALVSFTVIATLALFFLKPDGRSVRRVCADDVILRDRPGRLQPKGPGRQVGLLERGQRLRIDARTGNYVRGRAVDSGKSGWVLDQNSSLC